MAIISAEKHLIVKTIKTGESRSLVIRFGIPHLSPSGAEAYCHVDWDWLTDEICRFAPEYIYNKGEDTHASLFESLSLYPPLCFLLNKYQFFSLAGESLLPAITDVNPNTCILFSKLQELGEEVAPEKQNQKKINNEK